MWQSHVVLRVLRTLEFIAPAGQGSSIKWVKTTKWMGRFQPPLSSNLTGIWGWYSPLDPDAEFSPILVLPNLHLELSGPGSICKQVIDLPGQQATSKQFLSLADQLYIVTGYDRSLIVHNLAIQMLILRGLIDSHDLVQSRVLTRVSTNTLAAALHAAEQMV